MKTNVMRSYNVTRNSDMMYRLEHVEIVNPVNLEEETPLYCATSLGDDRKLFDLMCEKIHQRKIVMECKLASAPNAEIVNPVNLEGETPLYCATSLGDDRKLFDLMCEKIHQRKIVMECKLAAARLVRATASTASLTQLHNQSFRNSCDCLINKYSYERKK